MRLGIFNGSDAGLDQLVRHLADAVGRETYGWRDGIEHDGEDSREIPDAEQHDGRDEINEARKRLQRVDDGFDDAPGARAQRLGS